MELIANGTRKQQNSKTVAISLFEIYKEIVFENPNNFRESLSDTRTALGYDRSTYQRDALRCDDAIALFDVVRNASGASRWTTKANGRPLISSAGEFQSFNLKRKTCEFSIVTGTTTVATSSSFTHLSHLNEHIGFRSRWLQRYAPALIYSQPALSCVHRSS